MYLVVLCLAFLTLVNLQPAHSQFELPNYFKGSLYLVSATEKAFDLNKAQATCAKSGGYLVEFETDAEYLFVKELVTATGGTNHYFTGANDVKKEGKWVYASSGNSFSLKKRWSNGQPDNWGKGEDCMEIRMQYQGKLNDIACNHKGKFVCEIPVWRKLM